MQKNRRRDIIRRMLLFGFVMRTAAVMMLFCGSIQRFRTVPAALAYPVENGAGGVNAEPVVVFDMMCDFMQMFAVQMNQCPAFGAFQMKVRMTGSGSGFFSAVLPAGAAAVVQGIAADKPFLLQLFKLPVDCGCAHGCPVFGQRVKQLCRSHMPFRMRFQICKNQRLLFRLITALPLHDRTPFLP